MKIAMILIMASVLVALMVGLRIISYAEKAKGEKDVDYLIVLGASVFGLKPGAHLKIRLDAAIDILRKNPEIITITSGGKVDDEEYPEADVMKKYILDNVSGDVTVIAENKSFSTYENLLLSKELISKEDARVGIVTNWYHLYRALWCAKKAGIKNAIPIFAPSIQKFLLYDLMREIAIIIISHFYFPKKRKDGQ